MRLVDTVAGVRSGHVLMAHTSVVASMVTSLVASVVTSVAWLSLSLAVVAMMIAMKTLWTPVVVAGGVMTISQPMIAWLSLSLSLAIVAAVVIAMKTLWAPVSVAVASVRMVSSSVAIAGLGEGEGGQRENLPLINDYISSSVSPVSQDNLLPGF